MKTVPNRVRIRETVCQKPTAANTDVMQKFVMRIYAGFLLSTRNQLHTLGER